MGMPQSYLDRRDLSWLGFLKVIPICFAIATGSFSIARDALFLSGNAPPQPPAAFWTWLRISFVLSCGVVWFQQHKRLRALEKRLVPGLKIGEPEKSIWPFETHGMIGAGYHFDVRNQSELETINHARAEIIAIEPPLPYPPLPWPMKIKHDDYATREFSINPGASRQLDLVVGPTDDPRCRQPFIIIHTVTRELQSVDPRQKYRITVRISGDKVLPAAAVFEVWVKDGVELQCVAL
jgi:hypothetical protein